MDHIRFFLLVSSIPFLIGIADSLKYLIVFPAADRRSVRSEFQIMISTKKVAAHVQMTAVNMSKHILVHEKQEFRFNLSKDEYYLNNFFKVEKKAILVQSDYPIVVQGHIEDIGSTAGYTAFPIGVGPNEYIVPAYNDIVPDYNSDIIVAALNDHTNVTLSYPNGSSTIVTLPAFGTYSVRSKSDLTRTVVTANSSIAVYSGHLCTNVPLQTGYCDRLIEGIPPLVYEGRNYILPAIGGRGKDIGYIIRVLSVRQQSSIRLSDKFYTNMYQELDFATNIPRVLNCTEGCFVYQYNKGRSADSSNSDPFMMRVLPVNQYSNQMMWITPERFNSSFGYEYMHFVSIIAPTAETHGVRFDGEEMNSSLWSIVDDSQFSSLTRPVKKGQHHVQHFKITVKIAAYAYGHGTMDGVGYGFPATDGGYPPHFPYTNDENVTQPGNPETPFPYKTVLVAAAVTVGILLVVLMGTWIICFMKTRSPDKPRSDVASKYPVETPETGEDPMDYTALPGTGGGEAHVYHVI